MNGLPAVVRKFLQRFAADERGATALEYALIATFILMAIILAFFTVQDTIHVMYENAKELIVEALS